MSSDLSSIPELDVFADEAVALPIPKNGMDHALAVFGTVTVAQKSKFAEA